MIERVDPADLGLSVWYSGTSEPLVLPWFWIRDHSEDNSAYDAATKQRTIDSFSIDRIQSPASSELVDGVISVSWADGSPTSILSADTLRALAPTPDATTLWRSGEAVQPPTLPYEQIINTPEGLKHWLTALQEYGFCLATGVPPTQQAA